MKTVYGLMTQDGSANELLWDLGFWETEEAANEYLKTNLPLSKGIWVELIKVNDPIPETVEAFEEDKMVACSFCDIEYNAADILIADVNVHICVYCQPAYKAQLVK
ncbi:MULTISPECIES: hypothetical protein [Bacillaceae]|uniref:Uncharacterized protein n=2 Tax=Bacillus infantis TaxID=324767 RepID=U5L9R6_9BACI|nr:MULTISPECIES: hypothetical protein [Bacillus]AGX03357.1 hypothetical protein N288_07130 [Bacillus infantis NRRL B-14911]EAR66279.1 hypothetical protein B14911_20773 [Bacillus sp. NRRL B-14911]MCA1034208.1 hypothetical protein [Bacillus infantis]MCP1157571.1 hypothetical protein [Bacillus infantis]MCR6609981.1 hypothetical protein [Bacillus infantis]